MAKGAKVITAIAHPEKKDSKDIIEGTARKLAVKAYFDLLKCHDRNI